ncbi:MAG TPA: ABC transporter ATP-binding protein [Armatimonadota bacterium]
MITPALRLDNLTYRYPDGHPALAGLSLEVAPGESVALVGPNGAGKSTLLLHLNGVLRGEGAVEINGERLEDSNLRRLRQQVGLVFEDPNDQLFMPTVGEDVCFGPLNQGLSAPEAERRAREALAAVGMEPAWSKPPSHLSLGQRKRVAVATVLAMESAILALDDPTGGLDPEGREQFLRLIAGLPHTKLIATHDLELVWDTCHRVALLDAGQVVAVGPTREILSDEPLLRAHGLRLPACAASPALCPAR